MGEREPEAAENWRLWLVDPRVNARVNKLMAEAGIKNDISSMPLDALKSSLVQLEDWIENARLPGKRYQLLDGTVGSYDEALPFLLNRRRDVIDRIGILSRQEEIAEIKDAVEEKVQDPKVRQELSNLVSEIVRRQEELTAKLQAQDDADAREIRKIELQERRWDMRKKVLDREPAAVLIGGLLLLLLSVALVIAMFCHTPVPEVLTSMVLLILGYFFGQTASGRGKSGHDEA
ncbi:hypothetical protein AB0N05_14945 [Nocardia sp. NPDC051030]|uniref:hypothetical protein n=1 Tax=Nocardia sp. NPDC051030 TaxID=3155162 RepID=UPI003449CA38